MKNKILLIIVLIAIIVFLIGFLLNYSISEENNYEEKQKFIGKWETKNGLYVYTFYIDGCCIINDDEGKWKIEEDKLTIMLHDGHLKNINKYSFSDDGEILHIAGVTFYKQ